MILIKSPIDTRVVIYYSVTAKKFLMLVWLNFKLYNSDIKYTIKVPQSSSILIFKNDFFTVLGTINHHIRNDLNCPKM